MRLGVTAWTEIPWRLTSMARVRENIVVAAMAPTMSNAQSIPGRRAGDAVDARP